MALALALFLFMGPTVLGPRIGYSHNGQSIIPCSHCMKYLVVLIIIGAAKSKRIITAQQFLSWGDLLTLLG